VRKVLPMIERELTPFEVRPHWGKLFTIPSTQLLQRYEMSAEFKRLVAEHDPHGKFRNAFLTANLMADIAFRIDVLRRVFARSSSARTPAQGPANASCSAC
jgi:D-arabinono-1,4-lactone oxidase